MNLVIKSLDDSIKALNNPINDKKKIFLVTETVKDAAIFMNALLVSDI